MSNFVAPQRGSVFGCSEFYCTSDVKHDDGQRLQLEIASMRYRFSNNGLRDC